MSATLKEFLDIIVCRITEGSEYYWNSFGPNAYSIESWNGEHETGRSFSIVFDTVTQEVFEMSAHDNQRERSYRWINPDYAKAYREEATRRKVDVDVAYDHVRYIDLETAEDYYAKARAIFLGQEYDTRVEVPLDLDRESLFKLMTLAHEHDITLNQMVERVLSEQINDRIFEDIHEQAPNSDVWSRVVNDLKSYSA